MLGGLIQNSTGSVVGPLALEMASRFFVDIAFMGTACINENFDVLTPTIDKAFMKRAILQNAKERFLTADSTKFHQSALVRVNSLSDYTAVVTDRPFSEEERRLAQLKKVEIIVV